MWFILPFYFLFNTILYIWQWCFLVMEGHNKESRLVLSSRAFQKGITNRSSTYWIPEFLLCCKDHTYLNFNREKTRSIKFSLTRPTFFVFFLKMRKFVLFWLKKCISISEDAERKAHIIWVKDNGCILSSMQSKLFYFSSFWLQLPVSFRMERSTLFLNGG